MAELKSHCTRQKGSLLKAGITLKDDMTVVSNSIGQPIRHEAFLHEFCVSTKALGLNTGCHDAHLTQMANTGMDAKTLSRFAGHFDVDLNLQVYFTPSEELTVAAVNKADKIIYQAKYKSVLVLLLVL